jgi:hypothetical protein
MRENVKFRDQLGDSSTLVSSTKEVTHNVTVTIFTLFISLLRLESPKVVVLNLKKKNYR